MPAKRGGNEKAAALPDGRLFLVCLAVLLSANPGTAYWRRHQPAASCAVMAGSLAGPGRRATPPL